jgi:hypothetical protein
MRWTGLILAIVVGWAGSASGGQHGNWGYAGCQGCRQAYPAELAGEACCSPPGYSGPMKNAACCCGNPCPGCNNAWDGYCEHHAKVQAWVAGVGVPKVRCYPAYSGTVSRMPTTSCSDCSAPPVQQKPPTQAPPVRQTPAVAPLPPPSATVAPVPADEAMRRTGRVAVR